MDDGHQPYQKSATRCLDLHASRGSGRATGSHGIGRTRGGNLCRFELALAEAVTSAGLEGVRISEGNLPPRIAQNGSQDADRPGAKLALSHWRFQPWSPGSERGLMNLGAGRARLFEAEAGRFALSRDWLRRG